MPSGRPKEYDEQWVKNHLDKLPAMFKDGQSIAEVCAELGMCKDTFYRLKKEYPVFSDAIKNGELLSEAWWSRLGRKGASGAAEINPTTWIFNMKNRFGWKDKKEVDIPNPLTSISISDDNAQEAAEAYQRLIKGGEE